MSEEFIHDRKPSLTLRFDEVTTILLEKNKNVKSG